MCFAFLLEVDHFDSGILSEVAPKLKKWGHASRMGGAHPPDSQAPNSHFDG